MLIRDRLATGRPSISFEFFPPKSDEAGAQLEQTIAELSTLHPDFVSVTYGAGGSTREKTLEIVSRIRQQSGIEAMAHLTCVGATREEIGAVVERLVSAGVTNILALRGDPPKGETSFTAVEGGFAYANELVAYLRERHGDSLSIGGAAYPEKHAECDDPVEDLQNLKRKVDAGADFLITQLFYDNRRYWEFCERAFKHVGLDYREYVRSSAEFFRPAEVEVLMGDASKARAKLGWKPTVTFGELVAEMVEEDLELVGR